MSGTSSQTHCLIQNPIAMLGAHQLVTRIFNAIGAEIGSPLPKEEVRT